MKEPGGPSSSSTVDQHVQRTNLRQVNSVRVAEAERVRQICSTRRSKSYAKADVPSRESGVVNAPVVKGKKKRRCARCDTQLGRFFNSGSPCPTCSERICNSHDCRIRIYLPNNKKTWMCIQCVKERQRRVSSGEWMLRKADILMRDPVSVMTNPMESLTLPRGPTQRNAVPPSTLPRSLSNNANAQTIPRGFSVVSDSSQHGYYTATRGRPVTMPGIVVSKKKHAPPVPKAMANVGVTTVPASVLQQKNIKSATLGRPASTLVFPSKITSEREDSTVVVTTLKRPKVKGPPTPQLKEKYIHIEFNTSPPLDLRSATALTPKLTRKEPIEIHPRLLNGVGGINLTARLPVRAATLDRFYVQRNASFTEGTSFTGGTSPAPSWHTTQLNRHVSHFEPSTSRPESSDLSAATLPRAAKRTKRDDTSLEPPTFAQNSDHSLSLLNLGVGTLTKPQPALRKAVSGIQHPSYASAFSRSDSSRKSFMERSGSTRRSNRSLGSSFRQQDDQLCKLIWNTIALDYDDFLTVVKGNLQVTATYYLNPPETLFQLNDRKSLKVQDPLHVSIIEIKPFTISEDLPESPKTLLSVRNSFRVSDIVPEFQLVLQESSDVFSQVSSPVAFHLSSVRKILHPDESLKEQVDTQPSSFERRNSLPRRRPISPAITLALGSPEPKARPRSSLQASQIGDLPPKISPKPSPRTLPKFQPKSETEVFLNGLPKLREVSKGSPPEPNLEQSDGVTEFQKVLERFKERKKQQEEESTGAVAQNKKLEDSNSRKVDNVETVTAAFQHFRKVNEEVQDLKDFLKTARQSTPKSSVADTPNRTIEISTPENVIISKESSQNFDPATALVIVNTNHTGEPAVFHNTEKPPRSRNTGFTKDEIKKPFFIGGNATSVFVSHDEFTTLSKPTTGPHLSSTRKVFGVAPVEILNDRVENQEKESTLCEDSAMVTEPSNIDLVKEPSVPTVTDNTVVVVSPSDSKENLSSSSSFEYRRPERAKWHSSLLQTSHSFNASMTAVDSFAFDDDVGQITTKYRDDVTPVDSDDITPTYDITPASPTDEELPAKKCVPSVKRAAVRSYSSSDGEDYVEADFEEESDDSVMSDQDDENEEMGEKEALTRACRKVDVMEVQSEEVETFDDFDLWEMEAQPIVAPYDLFGRLQIPLDTIFEESEDEEKDSAYAHSGTMTRKPMRQVSDFDDLSPDELEDDKQETNGWYNDVVEEERIQPDLERYFTNGLLQPSSKRPYLKSDTDFDQTVPVKKPEEPSIFKSARLRFASADYRLSSDNDVDDLSPSNHSDDENEFY